MGERPYELIVAKWPEPEAQVDPHAKRRSTGSSRSIAEVRTMRAELNIPPGARRSTPLHRSAIRALAERLADRLPRRLARMAKLDSASRGAMRRRRTRRRSSSTGRPFAFPLGDAIDLDAEKARLSKGAEAAEKERDSLAQRLANPNFTERAKPEAVEKARADHDAKAAEAERLRAALERLGSSPRPSGRGPGAAGTAA